MAPQRATGAPCCRISERGMGFRVGGVSQQGFGVDEPSWGAEGVLRTVVQEAERSLGRPGCGSRQGDWETGHPGARGQPRGPFTFTGSPPHQPPGSRPRCCEWGELGHLLPSAHLGQAVGSAWGVGQGRPGRPLFPSGPLPCLFPSSCSQSRGQLNTKEHQQFLFPTAAKSLP